MLMKLPSLALRHLYYLACSSGLVLLHLLALFDGGVLPLLAPLGVYLAFLLLDRLVWARREPFPMLVTSIARHQRLHFYHTFSTYLLVALLVFLLLREVLQLSLADSLYSVGFILVFGLLACIDLTLMATRDWYQQGGQQQIKGFRLIPASVVLRATIVTVMGSVGLLLVMIFYGLYAVVAEAGSMVSMAVLNAALLALLYLSMMAWLMARIARRFADNLHYVLETQLKVVRDVQAGDYSQTIPLLNQDELGLMSMQLNRLLEYIQKRADVENMLKRVVSPEIMEKLMSTDSELLKRGEERDVAILFCDVRGFTEMSEGATSTEIIRFLNTFFSELAEMVHRHHGTINKFMGDAILAVYSAETPNEAVDSAMNTASEINMRVRQMRLPNGGLPETGTGIHFGRVVAGTIGSEQRYEYTYLGDAVNTASRLQGLSQRLGYPVIVSVEAYLEMSEYLQAGLSDLGQHRVRGKADPLHIYAGS